MPERLTSRHLAKTLHEQHLLVFKRIVRILGEARCADLLIEALLIEQAGGLWTRDGQRRTRGGTFLHLVRAQTTTAERAVIFGRRDKRAVGHNEQSAIR